MRWIGNVARMHLGRLPRLDAAPDHAPGHRINRMPETLLPHLQQFLWLTAARMTANLRFRCPAID